ncbi:hypothetical protein RUND412_002156 [Rhizina undulata]
MPPRKKAGVASASAESSTRSTRARTRAAAAAAAAAVPEPKPAKSNPSAPAPAPAKRTPAKAAVVATPKTGSKRKRGSTGTVASGEASDGDVEIKLSAKLRATPLSASKNSVAKMAKKTKSPPVKKKNMLSIPFNTKACFNWFSNYEDNGAITVTTLTKWFEELDISMEGPVFYIIAFKARAQNTFTITEDEFYNCMSGYQIDCNEKLLYNLPGLLSTFSPSYENHDFIEFYKFCFNYFKVKDMKNLPVDMASELFKSLLDIDRYHLTWKPSPEGGPEGSIDPMEHGKTPGKFPHLRAFIEYLNQDPKPANVITMDQYMQFIPFNRDVSWDLKGYKEDESAWPSLLDNYIIWRKQRYPASVNKEITDAEKKDDYY